MANIIVAGGAGFIGSHLCDRLISDGNNVVCVDNYITGSKKNIKHLLSNKSLTLLEKDISAPFTVRGKVDYVLNYASPASPVDYTNHPIETLKAGSLGTLSTLELAREKNAVYMMASTSEVYGDPLEHPQKESYWGNVNSVGPRSMYDEAKRFSEALVTAYRRTHKIDTKIARIFNTYGPRMQVKDGRVVPNFMAQAIRGEPLTVYGDGSQTRSFCYVSDLVEGIVRLMKAKTNDPVNLGNPTEMTMLEFAKKTLEITGSKSKITFMPLPKDDPKVRCPDITRARKLLDWEPKVSFDEGMRKTFEYFKTVVK